MDERARIAQEAREQAERDRRLNRERAAEAEKRAVKAQIRDLVESNLLPTGGGGGALQFQRWQQAQASLSAQRMHRQVVNGRLAIVRSKDGYGVIPAAAAEKIIQRDSSVVLVLNDEQQGEEVDDEYADFKVPDDLIW